MQPPCNHFSALTIPSAPKVAGASPFCFLTKSCLLLLLLATGLQLIRDYSHAAPAHWLCKAIRGQMALTPDSNGGNEGGVKAAGEQDAKGGV